jgi:cell division septum initiation protein DivIVA
VSAPSSEWPATLQEMLAAPQRKFPSGFRGYDRFAVDEAFRDASQRLSALVEECAALAELALVLEEELEGVRAGLAEYERLHAGEEVRQSQDPATRAVVERALQEANSVVADARLEARRTVERDEQAVSTSLRSLEDEERDGRRRLAKATAVAGDVVRSARRNCAQLLARLVERQQVADGWAREFADFHDVLPTFRGTVEIPRSRRSEDATAPRIEVAEASPAGAPHASDGWSLKSQ